MTPRIVLDTNVIVAAMRSNRGASFKLLERVGKGVFDIALSVPLLFEYEEVLSQMLEEGSLALRKEDIEAGLDYVCLVGIHQPIYYLWRPFLKDPDDDLVLEVAVNAGCSHIVTHNMNDFQGVTQLGVISIRPGDFLKKIGGNPQP